MNCKNCGNKLNDNDTFCSNCGVKNEIQIVQQLQNRTNNSNVNKKWKILNTSTISLIIFIIIILANVIVYPLSLSDDETSGMEWFFFVLLPSIPLFMGSFVLGIISICQFIKDKKNNINISIFRIIFIILNIIQLIIMILVIIFIITPFFEKQDNYVYDGQANKDLTLEYLNNTYYNQNDTFTLINCGYDLYPGSNERCYFKSEKYNDEITVYITRYDDEYRIEDNYFKLYMKEDAENYFNNIANQYAKVETKFRFSNLRLPNGEYLYFEDFIGSGECRVDVYFISNSEVDPNDINSILNNIANNKIYGNFNFITTNDTNLLSDYTLDEILNNQSEMFVSKEDYDINYNFEITKSY